MAPGGPQTLIWKQLWLEGIQLRLETNNKLHFLPIRLCFINVNTYPNPKPYNNVKTVIVVVQCEEKITLYWCAYA